MALGLNGFAQNNFTSNRNDAAIIEPTGTIAGNVTTTDGQPATSVNVSLKGTLLATTTNEEGYFSLHAKKGTYIIQISMVGVQPQEKTVTVRSNETTTVSIVLSENASELAGVVITARKSLNEKPVSIGKVAINPMDLPQSISVIGQGAIRDQQAQRLGEVVRNVNGVYLTTTRGNVQESFAARGYSFSSTNMFKNGFRVNTGVMPEVSSLEKVEVLKGSAAILYGQVAPGGIVNMVTKQPKFQFGGEVAIRAGSFDLYKPSFDVYGPVNENMAFRVNGSFETANSYRDVVSTKRYYVNPSLLFRLGQRTELVLEGDYLRHEFTPDFGIGSLDNTRISDLPRNRFLGALWSYNTTQQTTMTASVKHRLSEKWTLDASTSYQVYDRDYFSTERIQADANGDWVRPLGRIDTKENYYAGQVNLTGKFHTGKVEHTLLAGIDADRTKTLSFDFAFPEVPGLPAKGYDKINILDPEKYMARTDMPEATATNRKETPVNRYGVYMQDLVKLSAKLNLLAGVRWSYVANEGVTNTHLANGTSEKESNLNNHSFSPRFGLVYKPLPATSLFASYATSFVVNNGTDIYNNALEPSTIDQYEAGIKNELFNGKLSANLTLYRIRNNNLAQTAEFDAAGLPNYDPSLKTLAGETTSDGIEIDLASHPTTGLDIMAGYSYNYMRYTNIADRPGNYREGERLVNNPAHTVNASIFYNFQEPALKGLKAGVTAFYVGERFGGWNNKIDQAQNYSRLIPVSGFTTIDISAGYSYRKASVLLKVSNVTNVYNYYVHENYSINPIPPRQLIATLSYKF